MCDSALKFFYILLALAFASMPANARWDKFQIRNISITEGLSQNSVTSVFRDSQGYMWIGTRNGLNRYDNTSMANFYHTSGDSTTIPNNTIYNIFEDNRNTVWALTSGGLARYDRTNDRFQSVGLPGEKVTAKGYCLAPQGIIFGGKGSIYFWNYADNSFQKVPTQGGSDQYYFSIMPWGDNLNLLATKRDGLWIFDKTSKKITKFKFVNDKNITDALTDEHGNLWYAPYGEGLVCIDRKGHEVVRLNDENSSLSSGISSFRINGDKIYIASGKGIDIYDMTAGETEHLRALADRRDSEPVSLVYIDSHGNIYAGTERNGIKLYHTVAMETFRNSDYESSVPFTGFVRLDNSRIWCGTDGNGICVFDPENGTFDFAKSTAGMRVASLVDYDGSNILFSTYGQGFGLFGKSGKSVSAAPAPFREISRRNAVSHYPYSLARLTPRLFAVISDSVYIVDRDNNSIQTVKGIEAGKYGKFYPCHSDSSFIILSSQSSVGKVDLSTMTFEPLYFNNNVSKIRATAFMGDNHVVIAGDSGIFNLDIRTKSLERLNTPTVHNITTAVNDEGRLWVGAENRMFMFDGARQFSFSSYDGVLPNEFGRKASLSNGDYLFIGGTKGILCISKDGVDSIYTKNTATEIRFTLSELLIDGKQSLNKVYSGNVDLPDGVSKVTLGFIDNEANPWRGKLFRYYVEGPDGTNMLETHDRTLVLNLIRSKGKFNVKVSCNRPNGEWTQPQEVITFNRMKPWWKTKTALALYVSAILILAILLLKSIPAARRKVLRHKKEEIIRPQTDEFSVERLRVPIIELCNNLSETLSDVKGDLAADDPIIEKLDRMLASSLELKRSIDGDSESKTTPVPQPEVDTEMMNETETSTGEPEPQQEQSDAANNKKPPHSEFLKELDEIIDRHMSDPEFGLDDILYSLPIRRTTLHNRVKALTGKSTLVYINERKIEHAQNLLLNSTLSIAEIAERTGFKAQRYFSEFFKDKVGVSPTVFRNMGGLDKNNHFD